MKLYLCVCVCVCVIKKHQLSYFLITILQVKRLKKKKVAMCIKNEKEKRSNIM